MSTTHSVIITYANGNLAAVWYPDQPDLIHWHKMTGGNLDPIEYRLTELGKAIGPVELMEMYAEGTEG